MDESDRTVNIRDYGAAGDGVIDDRQALRAAVAERGEAGGTVHFPAGEYNLRTGDNDDPV